MENGTEADILKSFDHVAWFFQMQIASEVYVAISSFPGRITAPSSL